MSDLLLTLKEPWFSMMRAGVKTDEFRERKQWIESRLWNWKGAWKHKTILFRNGYGNHRPFFRAKLLSIAYTRWVKEEYLWGGEPHLVIIKDLPTIILGIEVISASNTKEA